ILIPNKRYLAPFSYGGLEVKSTIGTPINNYVKRLRIELGIDEFYVGIPRIDYLYSINYWGHHAGCDNLVGVYYDYCEKMDGSPQIMAVMHAVLDPDADWNQLSIGKPGSKKTSNTALSASGCQKILN